MKKLITLISMFMLCLYSMGADTETSLVDVYQIYATGSCGGIGHYAELTLNMKNRNAISEWNCTLVLPQGITYESAALVDTRYPKGYNPQFSVTPNSDGSVTFKCRSANEITMTDTDGAIATVLVHIPDGITPGNYTVNVNDISLVEPTGNIHSNWGTTFDWSITTNEIYITGDNGRVGRVAELTININNSEPISGWAFFLYLPEGVVFDHVSVVRDRYPINPNLQTYNSNDGSKLIACYFNQSNTTLIGNDGPIAKVYVNIPNNVEPGDYSHLIQKTSISSPNGVSLPIAEIPFTWTIVKAVTISFDTDGGTPIESITQDYGTVITPPANPTKEGYTFVGWNPALPETMPSNDLTVTALWEINKYNLVYVVDGVEYNRSKVEYGAEIKPIEEPTKPGYTFSGWSEIPETMPAEDVTVTGSFIANQYTVTTSVVTLGNEPTEGSLDVLPYTVIGGYVTVSDSIVISGHSSTITITPNEGFELKSVTVNGEDKTAEVVDSVLTLSNIQENKVVVVTFQKQRFSVTANECEGGSISLSATEVEWGDSVTVIVTADEGYEIASLIVGSEDVTEWVVGLKRIKCIIQCVTEDIEVSATFRLESFTITTNCNEGGSIVLSNDTPEWGSSVTITVTPDKGYELVSVSINGEDKTEYLTDGQYTIENVTANITVEAEFRRITEAIITLTADGESTYCCNSDLDFSNTTEIKAYIASGYYPQTGYVLLTRVLEVPAGTGIVVRGDEGTYKIPFGDSSAYYLNLLVGNVEPVTVEPTEGNYANLCLTMGDNGLGFYPVTTSFVMEANRARLQLPTSVLGGENYVKIAYEEDADAVRAAIGTSDDAPVYDLSGRQITNGKSSNSRLRRGVYIRNGQKVMIK